MNDNAPEILQQPINIFIPRNGKIGTAVKQVNIHLGDRRYFKSNLIFRLKAKIFFYYNCL